MTNKPKNTILIVDDDPLNLAVLDEFLSNSGFKVLVVDSGEAAVRQAPGLQPDLILLDVMLPGINGFEVCRHLKEDQSVSDIPVIFMTALADTGEKVKGFSLGAVDYITKPITVEEVIARVNTHLSLRSLQKNLEEKNIKLKESEARHRQLLGSISDGVFVLSRDWRFTLVNEKATEIFQMKEEDLLGFKITDIFPIIKETSFFKIYQEVMENRLPISVADRIAFPDVRTGWYGVRVYPAPEGILCIVSDITDRKRAEEELKRNQEILSAFMNAATESFGIFDNNLNLIEINERGLNGWTPGTKKDDLLGKNLEEFVPIFRGNDKSKLFKKVIETGQPYHSSDEVTGPEYGNAHLEIRAFKVGDGLGLITDDISERIRAQETIKTSQANLLALIENTDDIIVLVDSEGKGVVMNSAYKKVIKEAYGVDVKPGMHLNKFLPEHARATWDGYHERALSGEKFKIDFSSKFNNNRVRHFEMSFNPIIVDGRVTGFSEYCRDITERMLAAEKMQILAQQLRERVKELHCLFNISGLAEEGKTMEQILQSTVELIPGGWQYPEKTCARVTLDEKEFTSKNFKQTSWKQSCTIQLKGNPIGTVEVYYLEEPAELDEDPFIDEERRMLETICERLSRVIERLQAEKQLRTSLMEKEVLLKEIHHRVKNNLQLISSLLNLQARRVNDKESAVVFSEIRNRINSIALIHEKLYQSRDLANIDFGKYTKALVNQLLQSFPDRLPGIDFNMEADDLFLEVGKALPSALIINELLTNALKYAFPSERNGMIQVTIKRMPKNSVNIVVSDDGVGIPDDLDINNPKTLGLEIVRALTMQLHGKLSLERENGTTFSILFPMEWDGSELLKNRKK